MLRVLVADDPPLLARLTKTPLGRGGCRLTRLAAGDDPVAAAVGKDLVLLAEGPAFPQAKAVLRSLRAVPEFAGLPVVIAAAGPPGGLGDADAYVPLPVRARDLARAIERLLPLAVRRAPRRRLRLPALFVTGGRAHEVVCRDIGLGGAFLAPAGALAVGLSGEFRAPAARPVLSVPAEVVREGEGEHGVVGLALEFRPAGAEGLVRLARGLAAVSERRRAARRPEASP